MSDAATTADPYSGLGPPHPAAPSTAAARRFVAIPGVALLALVVVDLALRFVPAEHLPAALAPRIAAAAPLADGADPVDDDDRGGQAARVQTLDYVLPKGDLARMGRVPGRHFEPRRVVHSSDAQGLRNPATRFDEAEIVTLGDSFMDGAGTDDEAPAAALARETGQRVHSRALPSAPLFVTPRRLLESPELAAHRPRAIVWGILDRLIKPDRKPERRAEKPSLAKQLRKSIKSAAKSAILRVVELSPARLIAQEWYLEAADHLAPGRSPANDVVIARLRNGEERLLFGKEIDIVTRPDADLAFGAAASVIEVCRAFEARGVTVVPLLIPSSADVYGSQVVETNPPGRAPHPAERAQIDLLEERLAAAGISCVNLRAPFRAEAARRSAEGLPPIYYRDDTHWNAIGVEIAARLAALELRRRGVTRGR